MKVKIFFILSLILILGSIVSAADSNVVVKTIPGYKAYIRFIDPASSSYLNSFTYTANTKGEIKFVFSTTKDKFDVKIWLSKDGVPIINKEFDETFNAGEDLVLEIYPVWYVPPQINATNQTNATTASVNETSPVVNETDSNQTGQIDSGEIPKKDKKVTALSVQDGRISINTNIIYYILGLAVIAVILFFSAKEIKKHRTKKPSQEIKVTKLSDFNKSKQETVEEQEKRIASAKMKIEEAEIELRKMKNEDKIAEVKKRLIEDEKELIRLRSGK
jgi:hypothetical protein